MLSKMFLVFLCMTSPQKWNFSDACKPSQRSAWRYPGIFYTAKPWWQGKRDRNMDSVSDTSVKNTVIPSKSSLKTTRMCTCWTEAPMKSSQREATFHPWQRCHGHCRSVPGIWPLGSRGWNDLPFPWGCSGVQVEKCLAVKATSQPVRYCLWCEQLYEISLLPYKKHSRFNHMNAIVTDFIKGGGGGEIISTVLPSWYLWGFADTGICFTAKEDFESYLLQQELLLPGAMGSRWFRDQGHSVEAERISKKNPGSLHLLHPLHGEEESVSGYPPVGFLQRCSLCFMAPEQRPPWGMNCPWGPSLPAGLALEKRDRMVSGAVPLRCCSGGKIRKISVIATVIPAFLRTFCSKKIH